MTRSDPLLPCSGTPRPLRLALAWLGLHRGHIVASLLGMSAAAAVVVVAMLGWSSATRITAGRANSSEPRRKI